jgi:hypothetical protein
MEYASDEGKDWRRKLQQWLETELGCEVFNPNIESEKFLRVNAPGVDFRKMKSVDLPRYRQLVAKLVEIDCREITERSDFIICYWDQSAMLGAGTKGEVTMAKYSGKPVYMVTSTPHHQIPGWVLGCTTRLFASFEDLKAFLHEL